MVKILYLIKDVNKGDCVSALSHIGLALEKCGHIVKYMDPIDLISSYQREMYVRQKKPFPLHTIKLLDYYDFVFYSMDTFEMDARNCSCKTVFVHDELWKGIKIPPGTDYLICTKTDLNVLQWANKYEFSRLKNIFTDLKSAVNWDFWKEAINTEKTIPFAYMGNIRTSNKDNPLLNKHFKVVNEFVTWAKEHLDLWYQDPPQTIDEFVETIPKVKVAVHFSDEHGVGQGAWEALACGAILLEYPRSKAAEEAGLKSGINCYLFNTIEELKYQYEFIIYNEFNMIVAQQTAIDGRKLVKERHTIESLVEPIKKWINKIIPVKTITKGEVPKFWTEEQIESFIDKVKNTPIDLTLAITDKRDADTYEVPNQTSRGKKSFNEMK